MWETVPLFKAGKCLKVADFKQPAPELLLIPPPLPGAKRDDGKRQASGREDVRQIQPRSGSSPFSGCSAAAPQPA